MSFAPTHPVEAGSNRLPPAARRLLAATLLSAVGNGLVLPFLVIYLHDVRGMSTAVAGLVIAWEAAVAFATAPLAGLLIDRLGPGRVMVVAPLVLSVATASIALVRTPLQAFGVATLLAVGGAALWPAGATLMARLAGEELRERAFGVQFMMLNLGIGVGGLVAGLAVHVNRAWTFERLYLCDALTFLGFAAIVSTLLSRAGPVPAADRPADDGGYREVLGDGKLLRVAGVALLMLASGYGALDVGYPAFVTQVLDVVPRVVAFGFVGNTVAIVLGQLVAIRLIRGRSRSRVLGVVGLLWAASWGLLGLALPAGSAWLVIGLVVAAPVVFGVGETLFQPVMPALVNDLAPEHLRGRYNAVSSLTWNVAGVIGPGLAGLLLGAGADLLWLAVVAGGCLLAGAAALRLRGVLTPAQDGLLRQQPVG